MCEIAFEVWADALPDEQAKRIHDYLESLSGEQRRGLAGTRGRLAILAESDVARSSTAPSRPATTSTCAPPSNGPTSTCSASTPIGAPCSPGCSQPRSSKTS